MQKRRKGVGLVYCRLMGGANSLERGVRTCVTVCVCVCVCVSVCVSEWTVEGRQEISVSE